MEPTGVATIVRMGPLSIKSPPRREAAIWCLCPWATILGEPLLFLQLDPKLFLVLAKLCDDVRNLICKQISTAENLVNKILNQKCSVKKLQNKLFKDTVLSTYV